MSATKTTIAEACVCAPTTKMYTNDDAQVVELEVPDVVAGTIEVHVEGGELVFTGEGTNRRFRRRIAMRYPARTEDLQTCLRDGVLKIRVPNPRLGRS